MVATIEIPPNENPVLLIGLAWYTANGTLSETGTDNFSHTLADQPACFTHLFLLRPEPGEDFGPVDIFFSIFAGC
jgi:hypothetical protein